MRVANVPLYSLTYGGMFDFFSEFSSTSESLVCNRTDGAIYRCDYIGSYVGPWRTDLDPSLLGLAISAGLTQNELLLPTVFLKENAMPVVGETMLIVLPFGWVVCAKVEKRIGKPSDRHFLLTGTNVICRTGGVPWDELADKPESRSAAVFRNWGDVWVGPEFVMSRRWVGDLPGANK